MTALAALLASVACAATPVHGEPLPKSGSLSQLKWVQAAPHRAGIVAMLFAYDAAIAGEPPRFALWAGGQAPPPGPSQKILWVIRNHGQEGTLVVRGRKLGAPGHFVQRFTSVGAPDPEGTLYASIIAAPSSGCWRLDLSSGRVTGSLVVQVVVQ